MLPLKRLVASGPHLGPKFLVPFFFPVIAFRSGCQGHQAWKMTCTQKRRGLGRLLSQRLRTVADLLD